MRFNRNLAAAFFTAVLALSAGAVPAYAEEQAETGSAVEITAPAETDAPETLPAETDSTEPAAQEETTVSETSEETTEAPSAETTTETAAETETVTETAPMSGSWQFKNGKRCYIYSNGEPARGETVIDGIPYLFGYSGAQKTDWQTVCGKRYYYDPKSGEAVFGWFTYFEMLYYITPEDGKLMGIHEIKGQRYRFAEDGELVTGMFTTADGARGFAAEDGSVTAGLHEGPDGMYLTDADGIIQTGIVEFEGVTYNADPETGLLDNPGSGFIEKDGAKYYIDPENGTAAAGVYTVDEQTFVTDETGLLLSGWQEIDGKRFFADSETFCVKTGLFEEDGAWYYGTPEGLATGLVENDGEWLPFDETTGQLCFGWFMVEDKKYYLDPSSRTLCKSNFFQIKGNIYYFNSKGAVVTGLKSIGGALYAFDAEGVRLTGLQTLDDGATYYYFDPDNGYACTGLKQIEGGTIRLGSDGKQLFGWQEIDGEMYYTDPYTGYVLTGQQNINGRLFQFDAEGKMIPDARLYNQKDQQWEMVQFNERADSTMKASACGIFSFCNAIYSLNGRKADAVEVAYWAIDVGAYKPGYDGTTRKIFYDNVEQQYGESLNFRLEGQYWGSISDYQLQNHLLSGGVAVIHVKGHFMAVVGYDQSTGLYHVLESYESDTRGLLGDSWVDAAKMSSGNTNVDWYVLISKRYDDGSADHSNTAPAQTPVPDPIFPELFD